MIHEREDLIGEELRAWVGRASPARPLEPIYPSDVRRYVDATGDANPLWLDDEYARSYGYRGRLLPPTLVGWVPFSIKEGTGHARQDDADLRRQLPVPDGFTNVRNAGTESEWFCPVHLGEPLTVQNVVTDIRVHEGRSGKGFSVTQEERVSNTQEEVVFVRRSTIILYPERKTSGKVAGA